MSIFDEPIDFGDNGNAWARAQQDPWLGASPWYIAAHAPAGRVVTEARRAEDVALEMAERGDRERSARAWQTFAEACWVSAFVAWMEGR